MPPTLSKRLFSIAKDHAELASLEISYEKHKWWRRLLIAGGGAIFFLSSYVFLHIALVETLRQGGMQLGAIGLILGLMHLCLGAGVFLYLKGQKDHEPAMKGSRDELKRSLTWIEKHFF